MTQYQDFIPENIALGNTKKIGVYNTKGERLFGISLSNLTLPDNRGKRLYSVGLLSDIHIGEDTSNLDYNKALAWLSSNVDFICECGDLIHGNASNAQLQISQYKECRKVASIPIYACAGNHDGAYVSDVENTISTYTGYPLYYSILKDEDVYIFVGNVSSTTGALFTKAELQWLYETLEENRNKRCFLFQHVRPDDACGNALGVYVYDIWGGTEASIFESLLRHYSNVVYFHGHSHLKFNMQQYSDKANIDKLFGCWSVHIPSLSVPRTTSSLVNPSITSVYAESEGYVVDVYENGIHLRGRDFVKDEFVPIASYWLDTSLKTVEAGTYIDTTGTIKT